MTILAAYIAHSPAVVGAMARSGLGQTRTGTVRNLDEVNALEERTGDLLKGVRKLSEEMSSRRAHSDPVMFTPEQRARNIVLSYLAVSSDARRGDLRGFDGHLVEMKSKMPPSRDVTDAVDALNARRALLNQATAELEHLVAAVARSDMDAVEEHRSRIGEISSVSIPAPQQPMTTFEYLVQRARMLG
ncbi:hypothetical protein G6L37_05595 [Agrobacterium rubi]|nr:hypothetical protein [Agrobacterium rubi]NTF24832.1 hypothetical protein [Agrobacterium rubi]